MLNHPAAVTARTEPFRTLRRRRNSSGRATPFLRHPGGGAVRIASSEMLLDAKPLPHLKCCQRRAAGEVSYEADRHDDTR